MASILAVEVYTVSDASGSERKSKRDIMAAEEPGRRFRAAEGETVMVRKRSELGQPWQERKLQKPIDYAWDKVAFITSHSVMFAVGAYFMQVDIDTLRRADDAMAE